MTRLTIAAYLPVKAGLFVWFTAVAADVGEQDRLRELRCIGGGVACTRGGGRRRRKSRR